MRKIFENRVSFYLKKISASSKKPMPNFQKRLSLQFPVTNLSCVRIIAFRSLNSRGIKWELILKIIGSKYLIPSILHLFDILPTTIYTSHHFFFNRLRQLKKCLPPLDYSLSLLDYSLSLHALSRF